MESIVYHCIVGWCHYVHSVAQSGQSTRVDFVVLLIRSNVASSTELASLLRLISVATDMFFDGHGF